MRFQSRLVKLEEYRRQRRTPRHFARIVRGHADLESADWPAWLAEQPYACGQRASPERHIGMVVPERLSPEAWAAKYGRQPHGRVPDEV